MRVHIQDSVRTVSKQIIKLVGGASAGKVSPRRLAPVQGAALDEQAGAELSLLATQCLATIVPAAGAVAGAVRLLAADGQALHLLATQGLPVSVRLAEVQVDAACGACGMALASGAVSSAGAQLCAQRCGSEFIGAICAHVVAVPLLRAAVGSPFGVLTLFYERAATVPVAGSQAISAYAELLGHALGNAATHAEQQRTALQAERQSIANEIHDALAQTLYFAKMRSSLLQDAMRTENQLLAYKCARDIDEALEGSQKTVRELVTHFRCQMDPQGLKSALQKLVNDFSERSEIALEYVNRIAELALPLEHELQTMLIVREALVNVSNHSAATAVRLMVEFERGHYVFTVEDNGKGYESAPAEGHYGLAIMRERALRMGGELQIDSLDGVGTRVRLSFAAPAPRMELEE